jgi:diguanylate cyclase (GGDEF)-like protein
MAPYPEYPLPANEVQRLRELERRSVLDTGGDEHFDRIVQLASEVLGMPVALISLVDRDRQWFLSRLGITTKETPREMAFCAHAIADEGVLVVPDALLDERFSTNPLVVAEPHVRFYAGAPLRTAEGHNLGTLCVIDHEPHELSDHQLELLQLLAALVMRELELRRLATIDPVTSLYTRSSFFSLAEKELKRTRRENLPLSLLNIDVDDFRQINNRWGHRAGDRVLADLCNACAAQLRPQDLFGRIGDEEFAILLVGVDGDEAMGIAEAIRGEVSNLHGVFSHSDYQPCISGGLTSLTADDQGFLDLFSRADQALFLAKGNGRNQIASILAT